jgi:hypothetical protein
MLNLIDKNEELITYILILILRFELDWTWKHQVDVDSCEGQTWRIYFLPFDIVENYILWNNFDANFM